MLLISDPYPSNIATPSYNLSLTIFFLKKWSLIKYTGNDVMQFLQGQLTYNVNQLKQKQYNFSAYCNPNGKVISNLCIFHLQTGIGCIQRMSICSKQIELMKKYSIFSRINISVDNEAIFLGIAGKGAQDILKPIFNTIPNNEKTVISYTETLLLYYNFPIDRFLIITNEKIKNDLLKKISNIKINFSDDNQWDLLDIEAKYPIIDYKVSELFLPQETNIQSFDAISFNKGCYIGQEIIMKTQLKNIKKRELHTLYGKTNHVSIPGEKLEYKTKKNNHWSIAGTILASCQLKNGITWIQAILNKSSRHEATKFRIYNSKQSK
ncbi:tRNA-modifying protein YgfZ [Blochmannia endosymbiont of Colobopsis nipponica]|uniref:tRNA-modifying protein YgfZ n=1 Tax=Blochmannia endosymbiont of Colobopsis nipponica TaxID=2681987 RepID=UPI00178139D8|nr:tRNA-modifying protein YgfZ [Blochmannia endosymbiont of Colobopsis nipponica]QOI11168.1 tRNA-modifying protein YgfZ [Blochmannia endosymbiont of Colobopsis nipponica]